ncbi:hypothetical protein MNBD_GAMMA08-2617 [hydrothermal vent metagenome]|uniref:Uncharacterized protein n=1 Tax=hydrothermal vent metagenome TaxID=652676 RepID=A0A3B0X4I1_9ZZZZ
MQMLFIKKIFFLLLILFFATTNICSANTLFTEQFQVEPIIDSTIADRIATYYSEDIQLPLEQQKTESLNLNNQLDSIENNYSNKAVYWFIRGLQHQNIASVYIADNNIASANIHLKMKNRAYEKAIKSANTPSNKLSAAIFSTMKHGLPEDLKIEATQNELKLGGNGESNSYYWYLHWSNIEQLKKAGRDKEAQQAFNNMQKELKNSNQNVSIYNDITKKIKETTLKKSAPQKTKPKAKLKSEKKPKKEVKKKPNANKKNLKYTIIISVVLASIMILLAVTFYEIKQKKKKNKI